MNKELLLSEEEYRAIGKYNIPYIYSIKSGSQILYYFGSKHVWDPLHPQFELLQKEWQEFLQKTTGLKSVVVVEGNVNLDNITTLEEVVEKYGESGAIVFLANQAHIPSSRPEPTIKDEVEELLKVFSRDEIFYFYMIRGIVSWQRAVVRKDFDEFVKINAKRYKDALDWHDFDFSFELVKKIHKQIFSEEFDQNDKELFKILNSMFGRTKITEIAKKSIKIRDFSIMECIEKYWQEGYCLFIVYGSVHAVMQERAIRDMIEIKN